MKKIILFLMFSCFLTEQKTALDSRKTEIDKPENLSAIYIDPLTGEYIFTE
ncbi:hypothetical protein QX233_06340 [Chryseobacterium gambrini]|uniref:Uncharacterized protein n=1 Tax=Chryseobacterium gambrini TaxID=373672 RepID=A0AAJ1R4B3_9FLAO|nr:MULTISPECIES: hypothetical protein [Chryseobacterium]MDN4012069.1 hypothetical protein [Chryseobacterium gambrini]MDN4029587.1 hypothetical protein [Chryseobacterium gambrini]QWA37016.1 hypothetical protein KKI44_13840 [Chryseobacterium sp. ZHDP1]